MCNRFLCAAALVMACSVASNAGLIGSEYEGTVTTSAADLLVTPAGANSYTDLSDPLTFCVSGQSQSGCGLSGSVFFSDVDSTEADITFEFSGSASATAGDTFTVDLGDFLTPDGSQVVGIDPTTDSLIDGTFQLASFNGSDAVFTGTVGGDGSISAGQATALVFDDGFRPAPEPDSVLLVGFGTAGLLLAMRRRHLKSYSETQVPVRPNAGL